MLWTQSPVTAEHTHLLVSILVMGTAFNGLMNIPYALQLAFGWTRLAFLVNLVSVLLLVPLMIVLTKWYGAVGAASVWVILNVGYMCSLPSRSCIGDCCPLRNGAGTSMMSVALFSRRLWSV